MRVTLHQAMSGEVVERVRSGELDAGFTLADVSATGLSVDRLSEIGLVVALPPKFTLQAYSLGLADIVNRLGNRGGRLV
ncbi:LysR substrate-binding domain-containing protein [Paraburkholderia bryophila]|uniref:LysR substrate-binding domain-containing protein n=1 Tax=Paraburkholderia bryophila TaxID=420952 RepID=UPI003B84666B